MFEGEAHIDKKIAIRREVVFMGLAGLFLGTLAMLNILGISRQIDLSFNLGSIRVPFVVFVGVLSYPLTFLCTDLISELYGKRRARMLVWIGLLLNIWVLFILWMGGILPPHTTLGPDGLPAIDHPDRTFFQIRKWTSMATVASMIAYLSAQLVDTLPFYMGTKWLSHYLDIDPNETLK